MTFRFAKSIVEGYKTQKIETSQGFDEYSTPQIRQRVE